MRANSTWKAIGEAG